MFMLINGECGTIKCPVSTYKLCFSPVPGAGQCRAPGHHWPHAHWAKAGVIGIYQKLLVVAKCLHQLFGDEIFWEKNCQFLFKILSIQFSCVSGSMCSVLTHNADRRQWQQVTSVSGANHCHISLTFTTSYFSILNFDTCYSAIVFWNIGGAGFVQLGDIRIHTTGLSSSTWYKVCIVDEVRPLLIFIL